MRATKGPAGSEHQGGGVSPGPQTMLLGAVKGGVLVG
jgi:hypothetical protein